MSEQTVSKPKALYYDYMFNYFGGDTFNGNVIGAVCVQIVIRAYKNGSEVLFTEEPERIGNWYYCDIFRVSFDRKQLFLVTRNLIADNIFRIQYGFDKIEYEVIGYTLDKCVKLTEEEKQDLPDELKHISSCLTPISVSKDEFQAFLREHLDDFDITDNKNAQVPSFGFVE